MVSFEWKGKSIPERRFLSRVAAAPEAMVTNRVKRSIWFWPATVTAIIIVATGLMLALASDVMAADGQESPIQDCIRCHPKTLELHDKLGSGNEACWVCHDNPNMKMLRLADGSLLPLANSPELCQQCHQKRYTAWIEGTHGDPDPTANVICADCHDPHRPQIALNITKSHPPPAPSPPDPPMEALIVFGISLLLVVGISATVVARGEGP